MLTISELKHLISELSIRKVTEISFAGSTITLKIENDGKDIRLSAPVYVGENYIPLGVREAIDKKVPFDEKIIQTALTVDEPRFAIFLEYRGDAHAIKPEVFGALMDEFGYLVDHWKEWLDERDKKDLVHVVNRP